MGNEGSRHSLKVDYLLSGKRLPATENTQAENFPPVVKLVMTSPLNLFRWATSELSQDAFLCWLIAHAGDTERADLQRVARTFIALLYEKSHPAEKCDLASVSLCKGPFKQLEHTDVFFSAYIGGKIVLFLIEDKVHTSHHGKQLPKYAKWVEEQKKKYGSLTDVKVYFKTGYHFDQDRSAANHGYSVVGIEDMVGFLSEHRADSEILNDYRCHIDGMQADRRKAREEYRELKHDFVQHEFLSALKERCPENIAAGKISRGMNMGGTPWTEYTIATFPNVLAGTNEIIFLRLDARQDDQGKRRYYLCLRQYGRLKDGKKTSNPAARAQKLARLALHKKTFAAACLAANTTLAFSKPSNDYQGANESEIGLIFFDEKQTPAVVLEQWPALHRALIEGLSAMPPT